MVRTEIQLFLENVPGELGRLADMLAREGINIDALTIQDASAYVKELFRARGKSLKRIAPAASYGSMQKDSADFALIRLLVNDTDRARRCSLTILPAGSTLSPLRTQRDASTGDHTEPLRRPPWGKDPGIGRSPWASPS